MGKRLLAKLGHKTYLSCLTQELEKKKIKNGFREQEVESL